MHLWQLDIVGGIPAGPPPTTAASARGAALPGGAAVEVDRSVDSSGVCQLGGHPLAVGSALANRRVTLRLDGHLVHVVCQGVLARTLPCPIAADQRGRLRGARLAADLLPPPPAAGPIQVERRVPAEGVVMVTRQRIRVGRTCSRKTVTILIEDTCLRVLLDGEELSVHRRTTNEPVTRFRAYTSRQLPT